MTVMNDHRTESEVNEILVRLEVKEGKETIDELCHYGGLRELLTQGEDGERLSVEDCLWQSHMNS